MLPLLVGHSSSSFIKEIKVKCMQVDSPLVRRLNRKAVGSTPGRVCSCRF
jgi:hypothetical protein